MYPAFVLVFSLFGLEPFLAAFLDSAFSFLTLLTLACLLLAFALGLGFFAGGAGVTKLSKSA